MTKPSTSLIWLALLLLTVMFVLNGCNSLYGKPYVPKEWPLEFLTVPEESVFLSLDGLSDVFYDDGSYVYKDSEGRMTRGWILMFGCKLEWFEIESRFICLLEENGYTEFCSASDMATVYYSEENKCRASLHNLKRNRYCYRVDIKLQDVQ